VSVVTPSIPCVVVLERRVERQSAWQSMYSFIRPRLHLNSGGEVCSYRSRTTRRPDLVPFAASSGSGGNKTCEESLWTGEVRPQRHQQNHGRERTSDS
jgi:hypothetical protein